MNTANICVCLANADFETCIKAAASYSLVELRLDLLNLSQEQILRLLNNNAQVIATCRAGRYKDAERLQKLLYAIENGAAYIDVEFEAATEYRQTLMNCATSNGCRTIISYHNFDCTPPLHELRNIILQASSMGADVVKIAVMAHSLDDAINVMSLYENKEISLIAFAMGQAGTFTRIAAPLMGAPFTYSALNTDTCTAPNQLTVTQMLQIYRLL
jgi:3-dehydroquinate dehydratase type I